MNIVRRISVIAFAIMVAFPMQCIAAERVIGSVERQKGDASRAAAGESASLSVGSQLLEGDLVRTGEGSRLVIRFDDTSSLTLGENAEVAIDAMIYEPAGRTPELGAQSLKFVQGVFRYVSGKVSKSMPDQVALNTPVATIGIRGTEFVFGEFTVGMPPGESHYGFQVYQGAVEITSLGGAVTLDEPGEGTFLPPTGVAAPTPPSIWSAEAAAEARDALAF